MQGGERKNRMKFSEHQRPRAYHLKCLSNLSEEEIESGCRDSAPSKTVLQATTYHPFPTFFNYFATLKVQGVSQLLKQSDWAQMQDFK